MIDGFTVAARCNQLVESLLREEYGNLKHLQKHRKNTAFTEFKIARLEYALGKREERPSIKELKEKIER